MNSPLVELLRQRIREHGPLSFRDFMEAALYHPEFGYYSSSKNPLGREGDYYTSSDLDPIFGQLLARRFTAMAEELNVPAGPSPSWNSAPAAVCWLATSFGRKHSPIESWNAAPRCANASAKFYGFDVEWIDELPGDMTGCIFSNEFFDALPVHRVVRSNGVLREIFVNEAFFEIEGDPQPGVDAPVGEGILRTSASMRRSGLAALRFLEGGFPSRDRLWLSRARVLCASARHADVLLASSVDGRSLCSHW